MPSHLELGPAEAIGAGWVVACWLSVAYVTRGAERSVTLEEVFVAPAVVFLAPPIAILTAAVVGLTSGGLHTAFGDGVTRLPRLIARLGFGVCQRTIPAAAAAVSAAAVDGSVTSAVVGVVVFTLASAAMSAPVYALIEGRRVTSVLRQVLGEHFAVLPIAWVGGILVVLGSRELGLLVPVGVAVAVLVSWWWWLARRLYYAETINSALLDLAGRAVDVTSKEELDLVIREAGPRLVNRPMWLASDRSAARSGR